MRFFKIFLIVFFSLIGIFGATYGIMYAVGYFDKEKVSPENIYFENDEYKVVGELDDNGDTVFNMTVLTSTPDVTEKNVYLSFKNQNIQPVDGKISNGIIQIPEKANIGEPFSVKIVQQYYDDIESFWNKGGVSTIVAKTDIVTVSQTEASVKVDVPVFGLGVKILTGNAEAESGTISVNSTFTVEPKFSPEKSQYMYSDTTKTRPVYYSVRIDGEAGDISSFVQDLGFIDGKRVFKALQPTDSKNIAITAYVFNNSEIQAAAEKNCTTEAEFIEKATDESVAKSVTTNLQFVKQTISGFSVSATSGREIPFNKTSRIYANSDVEGEYSIGAEIIATDASADMSYKLSDVAIRILEADAADIEIISDVAHTRKVGEYTYHLPIIDSVNGNRNYWTIATNKSNIYFKLEVVLLGENGEFDTAIKDIQTRTKQTPNWSVSGMQSATLNWIDESDVTLKFDDAQDAANIKHVTYSLRNNLKIGEGSYSVVKYIAYTNEGEIRDMISGLVADSLFSSEVVGGLVGGDDVKWAEIASVDGEFTTKAVGNFNVLAIIISTNYAGAPNLVNGYYDIVSVVKNRDNSLSNQPLRFEITKTIKYISGTLTIAENADKSAGKLENGFAFVQGSNNIMTLTLQFDASDLQLFKEAWRRGEIVVGFQAGGVLTNVIYANEINIDGDINQNNDICTLELKFSAADRISADTICGVTATYVKLDASKPENIEVSLNGEDALGKKFEVYDGKLYEFGFGTAGVKIESDKNNRITFSYSIDGTILDPETNTYVATGVSASYKKDGIVLNGLVADDKNFNVFAFDKYGNAINDGLTTSSALISGAKKKDVDIQNNTYTLEFEALSYSSSCTNVPKNYLYIQETESGQVSAIKFEKGGITQEIAFDEENVYNGEPIDATITGTAGTNVELNGSAGISIIYTIGNNNYYLYNLMTYSSDFTQISGWIDFNADKNGLVIKNHFGKSRNFQLIASLSELNISQKVNFLVKPAIDLNAYKISDETPQPGALSSGTDPVYMGVYSANDIKFNFTWNGQLPAGVRFEFKNNDENIEVGRDIDVSYQANILTVNFNNIIGHQIILMYTNTTNDQNVLGGELDFYYELHFNVNANAVLKDEAGTAKLNVDLGTIYLNASDAEQGTTDGYYKYVLNKNDKFTITPKLGNETAIENCMFSFDNQSPNVPKIQDGKGNDIILLNSVIVENVTNITLSVKSDTLEEIKKLTIYIYYGTNNNNVIIGTLKVEISPDVMMNGENQTLTTSNMLEHNAFIRYNEGESESSSDPWHLVLVSGQTYTADAIKGLFKKASVTEALGADYTISFESGAVSGDETTGFAVASIDGYRTTNMIISQIGVASMNFPVIITSSAVPFVKYVSASSDAAVQAQYALVNTNLKLLRNVNYLRDNNIYNIYKGGATYNLFNEWNISKTGLSSYFEGNSSFTFEIVNEDGSADVSKYATFNNGVLITSTYGTDVYVQLVCRKSGVELFRYRIKIIPNSEMNAYYPFIQNASSSSDDAEYIKFNGTQKYIIDFAEEFGNEVPNYKEGRKRIMLETLPGDDGDVSEIAGYALKYSISSIKLGTTVINPNSYASFASITEAGELTILPVSNLLTVVVKADAYIGLYSLGASAEYKIIAGFSAVQNYQFRNGQNIQESYNKTEIEVVSNADGKLSIDLSKEVILAIVSGGTTANSNLLGYYIYAPSQNNKLSWNGAILSCEDIVSDLTATLVLFTRYGEALGGTVYKTLPITFRSGISCEVNVDSTGNNTNIYESEGEYFTYSGRTIDFTNAINIVGETGATVESVESITVDGFKLNSTTYTAEQLVEKKSIKIVVQLKLKNAEGVEISELFVFPLSLTIYPNIATAYTEYNPFDIEENVGISKDITMKLNLFKAPEALTGELVVNHATDMQGAVDNNVYITTPNHGLFVQTGIVVGTDKKFDATVSIMQGSSAISTAHVPTIDENGILTITPKAVAEDTNVKIRVTVMVDGKSYVAYITFVVCPNTRVTLNYPTANGEVQTSESIYVLKGESATISLNKPGLFGSANRIVVDGSTDEVTIETSYDSEQLVLASSGMGLSTNYTISWKDGATANACDVRFTIAVDGVNRATYVVRIDSVQTNVITANLNYFNDTEEDENGTSEIFLLSGESAQVLTNKYQLLSFTGKGDLKDGTIITLKNGAQVSVDNGENFASSITLNKSDAGSKCKWIIKFADGNIPTGLLKCEDASQTDNDYFGYYFSVKFSDIASVGTAEVKTRLSIQYKGSEVEYSKFGKNNVVQNIGNQISLSTVTKEGEAGGKIDIQITAETAAPGSTIIFPTYRYKVVFDFKMDGTSASKGYVTTIDPTEVRANILGTDGGTNLVGVKRYHGKNFTQEYFTANGSSATISMKVFMVTTLDYDYTGFETDKDLTFAENTGKGVLYQDGEKSSLLGAMLPISFANVQFNDLTYDFTLNGIGAMNDGNFVIFAITYAVGSQSQTEYFMVRILPDWDVTLKNSTSSTSDENTESTPLQISYNDNKTITDVMVATSSSTSSLIILRHKNDQTNYANKWTYSISEPLNDYLKISTQLTNVSIVMGNNISQYGDVSGYVELKDEIGYTLKFYVTLKAANGEAPSIEAMYTSDFVYTNEIWEGSTVKFIDQGEFNSHSGEDAKREFLKEQKADHYIVVSGLKGKVSAEATAANSERENIIASKTTDGQESLESFTLKVMPTEFYSSGTSVMANLDVTLLISSETVKLNYQFYIKQRYVVSPQENNKVMNDEAFDLNDAIEINDKKSSQNLGKFTLGDKDYSLDIEGLYNSIENKSDLNSIKFTATVDVQGQPQPVSGTLTLAKSEIEEKTDKVIFLKDFAAFKNFDFSKTDVYKNPKLTEISIDGKAVKLNTVWVWKVEKLIETTYQTTIYCLQCTTANDEFATITAAGNSIEVPFNSGSAVIKNGDKTYFDGKDIEIQGATSLPSFVKDCKLTLCTMDLGSGEAYSASINLDDKGESGSAKIIEFNLNKDGVQTKSLVKGGISNPWETEFGLTPISSGDLQKIKGIEIYSDSIEIYVPAGNSGRTITVAVAGKAKEVSIVQNYAHYIYVGLASILGETPSLMAYTINVTGADVSYESSFTPSAIQKDVVKVASSEQIGSDKISKISVNKTYIVQFKKAGIDYNSSIPYRPTPRPYAVDGNGNSGTIDGKNIDIPMLEKDSNNNYLIPLTTWARGYNGLRADGTTAAPIEALIGGLEFIPEAGSVDASGKIIIPASAIENQSGVLNVGVRAKFTDGSTTEVGLIKLYFSDGNVSVINPGTYTVQRNVSKQDKVVRVDSKQVTFTSSKLSIATTELGFTSLGDGETATYSVFSMFEGSNYYEVTRNESPLNLNLNIRFAKDRLTLQNKIVSMNLYAVNGSNILQSKSFSVKFDKYGKELTCSVGDAEIEAEEGTGEDLFSYTISFTDEQVQVLFGVDLNSLGGFGYILETGAISLNTQEVSEESSKVKMEGSFISNNLYIFKVEANNKSTYIGYIPEGDLTEIVINLTGLLGGGSKTQYNVSVVNSQNVSELMGDDVKKLSSYIKDPCAEDQLISLTWLLKSTQDSNIWYFNLLKVEIQYDRSFEIGGAGLTSAAGDDLARMRFELTNVANGKTELEDLVAISDQSVNSYYQVQIPSDNSYYVLTTNGNFSLRVGAQAVKVIKLNVKDTKVNFSEGLDENNAKYVYYYDNQYVMRVKATKVADNLFQLTSMPNENDTVYAAGSVIKDGYYVVDANGKLEKIIAKTFDDLFQGIDAKQTFKYVNIVEFDSISEIPETVLVCENGEYKFVSGSSIMTSGTDGSICVKVSEIKKYSVISAGQIYGLTPNAEYELSTEFGSEVLDGLTISVADDGSINLIDEISPFDDNYMNYIYIINNTKIIIKQK